MKTLRLVIISLLACCQTLDIFSQKNTLSNYFPQDAKMIIKMNVASLGQKMKWEDFTKSKMFEELVKDASEEGKAFLSKPTSTGVDKSQGIFVIIPANNSNKKSEPIVYGIPRDTGQIAATIKKLAPAGRRIKITNGTLVIHKQTAIAWNKDIFVIAEDDSKVAADSAVKTKAADDVAKTKRLTEKCKMLLTKQKIPFADQHFASLLREDGDVYIWIDNMQSQSQKTKAPQIVEMFNKNMLGGGNYSAGVIRFENGRTTMQMTRYVSATIDSLYKKYPTKNINTQLTGKLPAGQPIFAYSFRFSPAMLNEVLLRAGAGRYLDSLSKKKIRMDDVVSAIRGDMAMAVIKLNDPGEGDSVTNAMNGIQIFLAGGINDKQKFNAISSALQAEQNDTAKSQPAKKMKPFILSNDSLFVVSLSQAAAQKFLESSGTNQQMKNLFGPYEGYPSAFIIDLKTILGFAMQGAAKKRSEEEVRHISEALGTFDKLVSYGGVYNDGTLSSTLQLTLTNKDENSLKQFIDLFDLLYPMRNKKSSASTRILQQEGLQ